MPIKDKDFVEIEYTGKTDTGEVFDTTDKEVAKNAGIDQGNAHYGPAIICVGQGHVLKGLDEWLVGKKPGGPSHVDLTPEKAFGKKNTKFIQLIPTKRFIEQKVRPEVSMPVNIDGMYGVIKTVTGGRTVVDFNHPLANKSVSYDITIKSVVTDTIKKVEALCKLHHLHDAKVSVNNYTATITVSRELPQELRDEFSKEIVELTGVKTVKFIVLTG